MKAGRNIYLARMRVEHFQMSGSTIEEIYVVADSLEQAVETAEPTTGHANFYLIEMKLAGKAQVAPRRKRS